MKKKALKAAFPFTIPVLTGYLFLGMAFGILLQSKGYHFGWAIFMSIIIYAGSMQFAAIGLLAAGASIFYAITLTLMINARHLFYGLSLLEKYKRWGKIKLYLIFALTDETYSLVTGTTPPLDIDEKWFYFFISLLDHIYWITGATLGAIIGSLLPTTPKGIDFVMTALFVVIFIEQWLNSMEHIPALIGIFVSIACLFIFGSENFIIPAMTFIALLLCFFKSRIVKRGETR
jgi:Predicted branched-chain amino acid permease (azaleucine resistance)